MIVAWERHRLEMMRGYRGAGRMALVLLLFLPSVLAVCVARMPSLRLHSHTPTQARSSREFVTMRGSVLRLRGGVGGMPPPGGAGRGGSGVSHPIAGGADAHLTREFVAAAEYARQVHNRTHSVSIVVWYSNACAVW